MANRIKRGFNRLGIGTAALVALSLAGCDAIIRDPAKALNSCIASTEQVILLRQIALIGKKRENFEQCLATSSEYFCRVMYLDANTVVQQCMNERGFIFLDVNFYRTRNESPYKTGNFGGPLKDGVCSQDGYQQPSCYHDRFRFEVMNPWAFRKSGYQD